MTNEPESIEELVEGLANDRKQFGGYSSVSDDWARLWDLVRAKDEDIARLKEAASGWTEAAKLHEISKENARLTRRYEELREFVEVYAEHANTWPERTNARDLLAKHEREDSGKTWKQPDGSWVCPTCKDPECG